MPKLRSMMKLRKKPPPVAELDDRIAETAEALTEARQRLPDLRRARRERERQIENLEAEARTLEVDAEVEAFFEGEGGVATAARSRVEQLRAQVEELAHQEREAEAAIPEAEEAYQEAVAAALRPRLDRAIELRAREREALSDFAESFRAIALDYLDAVREREDAFQEVEALEARVKGSRRFVARVRRQIQDRLTDAEPATPEEALGWLLVRFVELTLKPKSPALPAWEGTGLRPWSGPSIVYAEARELVTESEIFALLDGRLPGGR